MQRTDKTSGSPDTAGATLTFDLSESDRPALLITFAQQPRGMNFSDLAALFLGVGLTGLGLTVVFFSVQEFAHGGGWGLILALVFLIPGVSDVVYTCRYRARLLQGLRIEYRVSVANGVASFMHNGRTVSLELEKLGRLWITTKSVNGVVEDVKILAYHDGCEVFVFDLLEISQLMDDVDPLLTHIVDYLNGERAGNGAIQVGYCSDYAADTPVAARKLRELASPATRMLLACVIAAVLLFFYFTPDHPSIDPGIRFEYPLLVGPFVSSLLYSGGVWKARSCNCIEYSLYAVILWPLSAAGVGGLFQALLLFLAEKAGTALPDIVVVLAVFALMTAIIRRSFGTCFCGAHPERGKW